MHKLPALGLLLPLALGIHLYNISHSSGLIALGCGFLLLALALLWRGGIRAYQTKQYLYIGGLMAMALALGMLRAEYNLPAEKSYKKEQADTRTALIQSLEDEALKPETKQLLAAISLGHLPRGEGSRKLRQTFARSGLAHFLAVSGYHLGLIVAFMSLGLRYSKRLGERQRALILLLGAWAFTALTGWGVPTVRAALMLSVFLLGRLIGRQGYAPNTLAFAASLQLLYEPDDLYSSGMWLSYVAVLSITLYYPRLIRLIKKPRLLILAWAWEGLMLTLSAQVLTLPLCLYLFGYVSWSFVYTTLPLSLIASALIPLGLISYFIAFLGLPLGFLCIALDALSTLALGVANFGASLDMLISEAQLPLWGLLVIWGCIFALTALAPRLYRKLHPQRPYLRE